MLIENLSSDTFIILPKTHVSQKHHSSSVVSLKYIRSSFLKKFKFPLFFLLGQLFFHLYKKSSFKKFLNEFGNHQCYWNIRKDLLIFYFKNCIYQEIPLWDFWYHSQLYIFFKVSSKCSISFDKTSFLSWIK